MKISEEHIAWHLRKWPFGHLSWRYRMDVISSEDQEEHSDPEVILSRNLFAKPMSLDEAVMQMKLTDNEFIVFTDSSSEKINVLYRRKDGNFGLIQPTN